MALKQRRATAGTVVPLAPPAAAVSPRPLPAAIQWPPVLRYEHSQFEVAASYKEVFLRGIPVYTLTVICPESTLVILSPDSAEREPPRERQRNEV